ncbi:MAG TPA: maleylpyruvate isomerase N-terminal domain-containing protein [Chitinophagaceae bacterium]
MEEKVPIPTTHLFPVLDNKLIELLQSLSKEEWQLPTIAKKWCVKDIAAHLLDGNIRTLSFSRDQQFLQPRSDINSYNDLVDYLNELNAQWVKAYKRVSPSVLIEQLEITGQQFCEYISTLDPYKDAIFPVAWAGEKVSKNWFHIAREYTEKFLHQQQIRDAVGKPGLITKELFYPFVDTFMCGLSHTYKNIHAEDGTTIQVNITTEAGGTWYLNCRNSNWNLSKEMTGNIAAAISIDPETAWKLFSKGISPEAARTKVTINGNEKLAETALQLVAVMA